jgi:hypothetical protein
MSNTILYQKNVLNNELKITRKYIENNQNSLSNLKKQKTSDYVLFQIEKLTKNIEVNNEKIKNLEERLEKINNGELDSLLTINDNKKNELLEMKNKIQRSKNKDDKKKSEELSIMSKGYYLSSKKCDRNHRYQQKNAKRGYNYYLKVVNSFPDYMKKNLENMPNNKGYLWRDVVFYGDLPCEKNRNTVLFEKRKGGLLVIHEWSKTEYKVFHKNKNDRKKLYSTKKRKLKNININTMSNFI